MLIISRWLLTINELPLSMMVKSTPVKLQAYIMATLVTSQNSVRSKELCISTKIMMENGIFFLSKATKK